MTLLKGLLVFAEMSEGIHFMPCLLQVVAWEVVEAGEPRESPGSSLPRQRSPDGNVLLHCGLPLVPREQPPLPLEGGSERDRSSSRMPPPQHHRVH